MLPSSALPSVSVVITARDPSALPPILRAIPRCVSEVVVVTSAPFVCAARPDLLLVRPANRAGALATGIAASTGQIVVTFPADGSADPAEIPRYVAAVLSGADLAVGAPSRWRRLVPVYRTRRVAGCMAFRRAALPHLRHSRRRRLTVAEVPRSRAHSARAFDLAPPSGVDGPAAQRRPGSRWAAADHRAAGDPVWSPVHRPSTVRAQAEGPISAASGQGDVLNQAQGEIPSFLRRRAWRGVTPIDNAKPPAWPAAHVAAAPDANVRPIVYTPPVFPPAAAPSPRREVGTSRRRLEPYRQPRPDLRVINGEGSRTPAPGS